MNASCVCRPVSGRSRMLCARSRFTIEILHAWRHGIGFRTTDISTYYWGERASCTPCGSTRTRAPCSSIMLVVFHIIHYYYVSRGLCWCWCTCEYAPNQRTVDGVVVWLSCMICFVVVYITLAFNLFLFSVLWRHYLYLVPSIRELYYSLTVSSLLSKWEEHVWSLDLIR